MGAQALVQIHHCSVSVWWIPAPPSEDGGVFPWDRQVYAERTLVCFKDLDRRRRSSVFAHFFF